jgi:glutaredoxin
VFTLQEIAPEIATEVDFENYVVVAGPKICPRCDSTIKQLEDKGIKTVKVVVEDSEHPLIVALKRHLGIKLDDFVNMPMVFVNGEFRWHDLSKFEIMKLAKSHALAA